MAKDIQKTMVYLPRAQHEQLRRLAFERRTSLAELIRQALEQVYGPPEGGEQGGDLAA